MIPKIIHYCWFGGNSMPEFNRKCIESWEKFFPGYKIIKWDESNFDINICDYVREAYEAKKWAFVSDYVRFYVLYKYGGVYMDVDVEVIRPIHDIVEKGAFLAREAESTGGMIAPGLIMGARRGNKIFKYVLNDYNRDYFLLDNGEYNMRTICERTTEWMEKYGYNAELNGIQKVDDIYIYPGEYFCPIGWDGKGEITVNTRSIHYYMASWYGGAERKLIFYSVLKQTKTGLSRKAISLKMFFYRLLRRVYR